MIKLMKKYRNSVLRVIDIAIVIIAYFLVYYFKNETFIIKSDAILKIMLDTIIISIFVYQIILNLFNVYKNITRYEGGKDYFKYGFIAILCCFIVSSLQMIFEIKIMGPKSNILAAVFVSVMMISYRLLIRIILTTHFTDGIEKNIKKNLLIIGAGSAARDIIKTIKSNMRNTYNIVGIIDDNVNKLNYAISNVRILGDRYKILEICKENNVDTIFFSISHIDNINKKEILNICQNTNAKIRILPSTEDLIRDKNIIENLRDVEIEDLLGREPIVLDNNNINSLINQKIVLVTGGGGSIGSELCRQIMKFDPEKLVILDIYENNLYNIEMELKSLYPNAKIEAVIGSVRDKTRLEEIFSKNKPYLVFHAAAHKHVPLMEISPKEAIKNNVFGTYNVVNCCDKYNVKKFVLISTDKAVNPTNIMGATKRICEMIVQAKNKVSNTEYVAVRFGNVLGSNGSVVPLFKKQIAKGGPVTVTHKEITRFFMTIPEATQLVLQAITYAEGGEIFVLDMGNPVKIYDLAISLIKLSGFEPDKDIPIKITGLRPGEKLYEELLMNEEGLTKTEHNKIFVAKPMDIQISELNDKLSKLAEIEYEKNIDTEDIKKIMKQIVPTYVEPEKINRIKEKELELPHTNVKNKVQVLINMNNSNSEQSAI